MYSSLILLFISIFQSAIITQGDSHIGFIFKLSLFRSNTHCTIYLLCSYNLFVAIPLILNKPWPALRIFANHTRTSLLNNLKRICKSVHYAHARPHVHFHRLLYLFMLQSFLIQSFIDHGLVSLHLNPFFAIGNNALFLLSAQKILFTTVTVPNLCKVYREEK